MWNWKRFFPSVCVSFPWNEVNLLRDPFDQDILRCAKQTTHLLMSLFIVSVTIPKRENIYKPGGWKKAAANIYRQNGMELLRDIA